MSPEIHFDGVPEKFQKLFIGSARDVLKEALNIINSSPLEEQRDILNNPIFFRAVNSALFNTDQRRRGEAIEFISQLPTELQPQAASDFLGENN